MGNALLELIALIDKFAQKKKKKIQVFGHRPFFVDSTHVSWKIVANFKVRPFFFEDHFLCYGFGAKTFVFLEITHFSEKYC